MGVKAAARATSQVIHSQTKEKVLFAYQLRIYPESLIESEYLDMKKELLPELEEAE